MEQLFDDWQVWARALAVFLGAPLLAWVVHRIFFRVARRFARATSSVLDDSFLRHLRGPTQLILPVLAAIGSVSALPVTAATSGGLRRALGLVLIAAVAWLLIALLHVLEDYIASRYRMDVDDNLAARRVRTQMHVLHRILTVVVVIFSISIGLMTFPSIRQIGTSLLASAGLAGLVVGLAARPVIANILAGLQLALTEPLRLDDVVIVEGEWGRIEEITTTYVVVRIWDLRRLVVPLTYFIEKPFQNWTRQSSDILGTVFLYADYSVPVEPLRAELRRILEDTPLWDGNVCVVQITNATERTVEIRALVSARNSGQAWDLRCLVREKLIGFLQKNYPGSLPRMRAEVEGTGESVSERASARN